MKKILIRLSAVAVLCYGALLAYFYLNQSNLLYHPYPNKVTPDQSRVPEMEEVHYQTADGLDLYGWYYAKNPDAPLIVYFHGNTGDLVYQDLTARGILDEGYNLLMVEYRGFGGNSGDINEEGLMNDARAALSFAEQQGWPKDQTVLWGRSLGTGVAVQMATEGEYKAMILEAPYSSVVAVAQGYYPYLPMSLLMHDHYDSAARIGDVDEFSLIYHGSDDVTVPPESSLDLQAHAGGNLQRVVITGADHTSIFPKGGNDVAFAFLDIVKEGAQ